MYTCTHTHTHTADDPITAAIMRARGQMSNVSIINDSHKQQEESPHQSPAASAKKVARCVCVFVCVRVLHLVSKRERGWQAEPSLLSLRRKWPGVCLLVAHFVSKDARTPLYKLRLTNVCIHSLTKLCALFHCPAETRIPGSNQMQSMHERTQF